MSWSRKTLAQHRPRAAEQKAVDVNFVDLGGAMMACVDCETMGRLASLADSSHALSCVLALTIAGTPHGEISDGEMDTLTDLSYKILLNIDELRETLAQVAD